jgi:hypothetical protein
LPFLKTQLNRKGWHFYSLRKGESTTQLDLVEESFVQILSLSLKASGSKVVQQRNKVKAESEEEGTEGTLTKRGKRQSAVRQKRRMDRGYLRARRRVWNGMMLKRGKCQVKRRKDRGKMRV